MPELNLQHIDRITRDISRQEISFSHLLEDLIDHVCCDVEYEMQGGLSFPEAYNRVKQKMGSRRLKEIQEETLYAVDTKYRKMKNTMKISGVAGTILFGFSAIFKIEHFPGATILMTLGALLLAFVFLPSALGVLWKETHNRQRLFLFISAFFAGMFFILGTLLKIQHWPGAAIFLLLAVLSGILFFIPALLVSRLEGQVNKTKRPVYILGAAGIIFYSAGMFFKIQHGPLATLLLVIGVITLCVIAFPLYTWITWKEDTHINAQFIFILIGSLAIVVPGILINLNEQNNYDTGYYIQIEQQQVLFKTFYNKNVSYLNQYRDSSCYEQMDQLHSKTINLLNLIGNIQTKMVAESEGKPGIPALNPSQILHTEGGIEIRYDLLSRPFHMSPANDFLIPGCNSRLEVNTALAEYVNFLSGIYSAKDRNTTIALPDLSKVLPDNRAESTDMTMMSALHSTELLKNSILAVESHTMKTIAKN